MIREKSVKAMSGWGWLAINLIMYGVFVYSFIAAISQELIPLLIFAILLLLVAIFVSVGFFIVNPNEAAVLLLFGSYRGTCKQNGFRFANPLLRKIKISLRARNLNGDKLKVNDLSGNPIEIAAVVVWQVNDTVEALFEVDDYEEYVMTQSEAAVRHLASSYPYDGSDNDESELTLRGTTEEINEHLQRELQERLGRAGVRVIEARLSHLAYAPEIAQAMLQRQQASAVVAARKQIVEGAVGMVELALAELVEKRLVVLDDQSKSSLVSNLLVVLCSDHAAQPVLNTGSTAR